MGRERFHPLASERAPHTERTAAPEHPAGPDGPPTHEQPTAIEPVLRRARPAIQSRTLAEEPGPTTVSAALPEADDSEQAAATPAALAAEAAAHGRRSMGPRPAPARGNGSASGNGSVAGNGAAAGAEEPMGERGATAPQLRRFIKSRAYVPMHELRRRFAINGGDDEVTGVDVDRQRVYVGLPEREGRLLGELLRGGDIGYELSMDPISPIVVGVYPMRPVTRA